MADVSDIKNIERLVRDLQKLKDHSRKHDNVVVFVGFTQNYAIYVHEIDKNYVSGEYKYLEKPAREMQNELASIVKVAASKGAGLDKALVLAGMRLQAAAQKLCPVDTGALRASAFTAKEDELEMKAAMAYQQSLRKGGK